MFVESMAPYQPCPEAEVDDDRQQLGEQIGIGSETLRREEVKAGIDVDTLSKEDVGPRAWHQQQCQ